MKQYTKWFLHIRVTKVIKMKLMKLMKKTVVMVFLFSILGYGVMIDYFIARAGYMEFVKGNYMVVAITLFIIPMVFALSVLFLVVMAMFLEDV